MATHGSREKQKYCPLVARPPKEGTEKENLRMLLCSLKWGRRSAEQTLFHSTRNAASRDGTKTYLFLPSHNETRGRQTDYVLYSPHDNAKGRELLYSTRRMTTRRYGHTLFYFTRHIACESTANLHGHVGRPDQNGQVGFAEPDGRAGRYT